MKTTMLTVIAVLASAAAGCGDGSSTIDATARYENASPPPAASARPAAPPKPDYSVTADSFANIEAAITALTTAAAEEDTVQIVRADKWLVMQGDKAVGPLAEIFNDEDAELTARVAVCRPLRQLGPGAKDALQQGLDSSTQQIQLNAIKGLSAIRPTDPQIIATLVDLMDHPESRIRREAILGLENVGQAARGPAEQKLIALLNDPDENEVLRDCAKRALKKVAPRRKFTD